MSDVLQAAKAEVKAAQEHVALFHATVLAGPDVGPAFHHLLEIVAGLYPEQVGEMQVLVQGWQHPWLDAQQVRCIL